MFHYFDYSDFFTENDRRRYELIRDGAEYVQLNEKRKAQFMDTTKRLKDVFKICTS